MERVQVQIVLWQSRRLLERLLSSLRTQTFRDFSVLLIDNGSEDGSLEYARQLLPSASILKNVRNLGPATAHNQGIALALKRWPQESWKRSYILVLNPDVILTPSYLENIISVADIQTSYGAFGGKLRKLFDAEGMDHELSQVDYSEILDSTGLIREKNGQFFDRGAGELDREQYPEGEIFGLSAGAVIYRASALATVEISEVQSQDNKQKTSFISEWFDEDFFNCKEDQDLAWRLQRLAGGSWYVRTALGYHYRGVYDARPNGFFRSAKNRMPKSEMVGVWMYRNHLLMLTKNLSWLELLKSFYILIPYEFAKFFSLMLTQSRVAIQGFAGFLARFPRSYKKRRIIFRKAKLIIRDSEIEKRSGKT